MKAFAEGLVSLRRFVQLDRALLAEIAARNAW